METFRGRGNEGAAVEIPTVSKDLYTQTRDVLAREGFTFITAIQPVSIGQLLKDKTTKNLFGYIDPSKVMRSNVPPRIEVAIDPYNLRIKESNNKPTRIQNAMIGEQEAALKSKLPESVRGVISMAMPQHASVLVQLDLEYQRRTGVRALFTNWFGSADDQGAYSGCVSIVGRDNPIRNLRVESRFSTSGYDNTFAVAVVMLPRELST